MIRPVISSGDVFAGRLVGDLVAAPQHDDAVGHREDVGHAVADQHHGDAVPLQLADEIEHLRHLAHGDRGRRLVHQHDSASLSRVRAMATACRWPPDIERTMSLGRVSDRRSLNSRPAAAFIAA